MEIPLQIFVFWMLPYRVGVSYPPCAVRDVNTLLNLNCKYDWILAVQFGHTQSINTQPRVNSRREEEDS
jgi:hypothetical protein